MNPKHIIGPTDHKTPKSHAASRVFRGPTTTSHSSKKWFGQLFRTEKGRRVDVRLDESDSHPDPTTFCVNLGIANHKTQAKNCTYCHLTNPSAVYTKPQCLDLKEHNFWGNRFKHGLRGSKASAPKRRTSEICCYLLLPRHPLRGSSVS